jgi:hypothetical protein
LGESQQRDVETGKNKKIQISLENQKDRHQQIEFGFLGFVMAKVHAQQSAQSTA